MDARSERPLIYHVIWRVNIARQAVDNGLMARLDRLHGRPSYVRGNCGRIIRLLWIFLDTDDVKSERQVMMVDNRKNIYYFFVCSWL